MISKVSLGVLSLLVILVIASSLAIKLRRAESVLGCEGEPEPTNDWDDRLGPVQSIRIEDAELGLSDKPFVRQTSTFNREGHKIEQVQYRDDGVALPKTTYSYDQSGRLSQEHIYQINGTVYLEETYTYSSNGQLTEQVQRSLDDNHVLRRRVYSHDPKRRYTEVSEFDWGEKLRGRIGFIRDSKCRLVEAFDYRPDNAIGRRMVMSYDEKGNLAESVLYSSDGGVAGKEKNEYVFDTRGNWTRQTKSKWVTENGKSFYKPTDITYRTITYY
jgi:hypothetical protein